MASSSEQGELSRLSLTELAEAYVESIRAQESTEHVGRKNRLARRGSKIVQELKARGAARPVLAQLAAHENAKVRSWAGSALGWIDRPAPAAPPPPQNQPFRAHVLWQSHHPPPAALARDQIAERLQAAVPEASDRLMALLRPAIGLWPQRRTEVGPTASRFGGMPLAPPRWQWPVAQEEPRLFVAQINCAEFAGLAGAEALPPSGLLAFFGDHDAVTGCFPFDSDCVFYWPNVDRLVPAAPEIEPLEIFPTCALVPCPCLDLPHPSSHAIGSLGLTKDRWRSYFDVWAEVRDHGIPREYARYAKFSKIFGWPDLVQSDLQEFDTEDDARLLLQVDGYSNGEQLHSWGPGGTLYYVISEQDLRARTFEACELEGQFT